MAVQLDPGFLRAARNGLEECGWHPSKPLVVACSGGADSTALLLACASLASEGGGQVTTAHFDHKIRAESEKDRERVKELGRLLDVAVVSGVGDVPAYAKDRSMSIEAAARELRYRFLADAVESAGAQGVATGHTLDDQAETVLMNVLRGTGTRGLSGMRWRTERPSGRDWGAVVIMRPLLGVRHSECEAVCRLAGIDWLEDPSNLDTSHLRNSMRHELLPLAEQIRPGAIAALSRLADNVRAADHFMRELSATQAQVVRDAHGASVARGALRSLHPALQSHVLATMYEVATGGIEGLEQDHIWAMRDLAVGDSGTELSLPGGVVFRVDYEKCSVSDSASELEDWLPKSVPASNLPVPGEVELPGSFVLSAHVVDSPADPTDFADNVAHLAVDAVHGVLKIRARAEGDRFHPLGMKSPIRLQDFFVNAHVPERFRERIPLLVSDRGIAWVAGHRIAEWAKMQAGDARAVRIELQRR